MGWICSVLIFLESQKSVHDHWRRGIVIHKQRPKRQSWIGTRFHGHKSTLEFEVRKPEHKQHMADYIIYTIIPSIYHIPLCPQNYPHLPTEPSNRRSLRLWGPYPPVMVILRGKTHEHHDQPVDFGLFHRIFRPTRSVVSSHTQRSSSLPWTNPRSCWTRCTAPILGQSLLPFRPMGKPCRHSAHVSSAQFKA